MKKKVDMARAWRDQDYYLGLTEEERASVGVHPAGALVLEDTILKSITGGCTTEGYVCEEPTFNCQETVHCQEETVSVCPPLYCT